MMMSIEIDGVLSQRQAVHGKFATHADIAQGLKAEMRKSPNWEKLSNVQKEGLEMVQHKIARILNGDPDYEDHYVDVMGYTSLILQKGKV
jgi:hypothetical protein